MSATEKLLPLEKYLEKRSSEPQNFPHNNIDYFDRKTSDMLVQVPMPAAIGLPNTPWSNAGSVKNRGFEFILDYHGKIGNDFSYNIAGNIYKYSITNNKKLSAECGIALGKILG